MLFLRFRLVRFRIGISKKARRIMAVQYRVQRILSICIEPVGLYAMMFAFRVPFRRGWAAERFLQHHKAGVAACDVSFCRGCGDDVLVGIVILLSSHNMSVKSVARNGGSFVRTTGG